MPARLIDGLALAQSIRAEVKNEVAQRAPGAGRAPGLAVILVGENPASQIYVRNKVKACQEAGFHSRLIELPVTTSQSALVAEIDQLNHDRAIDGILVQLPLPDHIDDHVIIHSISPEKDVDGFHPANAGALLIGRPRFRPCTPFGVMRMLASVQAQLRGSEAVVVGASNIVGKPLALMLLQEGATITLCNSKTQNLAEKTRRADILVSAVGKPKLITADMVKPGAVVIDVGINRLANGALAGDVDFNAVRPIAGAISPVPGGVGPMTIAMLLVNTLESFHEHTR
ncbi:MAG: bifunctional methylenetetrahydrofolate dehydrogenase/methenyltetrahydrofolate cyclohydrolase FolD [Burkholderiaceae bacterium]